MKYPIENDCLYISIDGNSEKQLMPKFLLQVFHKNFIITWWVLQKKVEWKKQAMNTIILSPVIQTYEIFFHPNSKIWPPDTKSCVVVSVAYLPKARIHHYYHGMIVFWKKLEYQSCNAQNRKSGKTTNHSFDTYKNNTMLHGNNIFKQHLK